MFNNSSLAFRAFAGALALTTVFGLPAQAAGMSATQSRAQIDAAYTSLVQSESPVTTNLVASETRSCWMWYFGPSGSKCMGYNDTTPGVGRVGAQGNQAPNCPTVPVGVATRSVTPPAGGSSCFQWVDTGAVSMPVEVALPPNVTGIVELFVILPNGAGFKLTEARTGTPLAMNYSLTGQRVGLVFRPFTGPGGQNFSIGVNVPALVAPTSLNDTANTATEVPMNRGVSSTITTPGSSNGYYFYPLDAGETKANYNIVRTSNQTVGIRSAQLLAPNVYALGTETIVPVSASGQTTQVTSANSNTAGTTTPYGFMVRVSGANAAAPADEAYSVRLSGGRNYLYSTTTDNTENISRYYPISGAIQVATYLTVTTKVKDATGNFVPNEPVTVEFRPNLNAPITVQTMIGVTDEYGFITMTGNFPACSGTTLSQSNYGPFGSPTDHWNGTAQRGNVTIKVVAINAPVGYGNQAVIPFTRICSETYLGRY